jgi:hypothetical protein
MSEPNSEIMRMAAEAAETLIGYYPTIQASDPKIYAAGLVKLFSRYPEHLIAEAIDPVNGLPGECDYLPTIAKVKAFIEPRWLREQNMLEMKRRFETKRLPEPERDPVEDAKIEQGLRQLSAHLAAGLGPSSS